MGIIILGAIGAWQIVWDLCLEKIPAQSALLGERGEIMQDFPKRGWISRWDKRLKVLRQKSYAPVKRTLALDFQFACQDGQVEKLAYKVSLRILGKAEEDIRDYESAVGEQPFEKWMGELLRDFRKHCGSQIARIAGLGVDNKRSDESKG